jgi:hypothetical protein
MGINRMLIDSIAKFHLELAAAIPVVFGQGLNYLCGHSRLPRIPIGLDCRFGKVRNA